MCYSYWNKTKRYSFKEEIVQFSTTSSSVIGKRMPCADLTTSSSKVYFRTPNALQRSFATVKKNPSLQEFINVINLDTLQEIPAVYAESGETGAADLAFTVTIRENDSSTASEQRKDAELLVSIIEEHKFSPDKNVI